MIDIKFLQDNPEIVDANNKKRGFDDIDISKAEDLAKSKNYILKEVEELRAKANDIASQIPKIDADEREEMIAKGKEIKEKVKESEAELTDIEGRLQTELKKYPNILRDDVPEGDETNNELIRTVGKPTEFDFEPKDHLELGESLDILDFERASKVSGSRFTYLKNEAALLEFALIQYALETLVPEGFVPILPPHIISTQAMGAMGYLEHGGEEEIFHLRNDDAVLIGTSEQAIGPMFMNETLDADKFPYRFLGISPCYRREAGSYGKDTRGMIRMHQFNKVEMFSFTHPNDSDKEHEFLLLMQEKLMQGLDLPYRVMKLAAGDTGSPSARTYDIETWMPSQNTYRETHSTSNTTDFQTRRLNTRYKKDSDKGIAHALNGTVFAMSRIPVAIYENYQQKDGSIIIPEVLRTWMGKGVIENI